MAQENLSTLLGLIDEWVAELAEDRLSEQCRKSGSDFFSYMRGRGVYQGWMVDVIRQATGYTPQKLWLAEDANLLRDAISRYEYSVTIARNSSEDPYKIIKREWS